MEEIKVKRKNEEGKTIEKSVPKDLVSNYLLIGWELVKEKEKEMPKNEPLVKDNK